MEERAKDDFMRTVAGLVLTYKREFDMKQRITLLDQDGHTVKLSKEEIAACLKEMGNPAGRYEMVPVDIGVVSRNYTAYTVLQIRARTRPNYSRFTLWQKKRMGSKLLDRKVPMMIAGKEQMVLQEAKPVWLRLKRGKVVTINVE